MAETWQELLKRVGKEEFDRLMLIEFEKVNGMTVEEYLDTRLVKNPEPMSEIQEIKLELEFARFDNYVTNLELEDTKKAIASIAPVLDITLFNAMMEKLDAISNDTSFVRKIYTKPKSQTKPKKQSEAEVMSKLKQKILSRGKKSGC